MTHEQKPMTSFPKLLKERQFHSRIFAVCAILILFVSHPSESNIWLSQLMLWLGYTLVIIGTFGRVYCSAFIGGKKNDVVVRDGPFSVVRNPLYVFSFIALVGVGLESQMFIVLLMLAGAFALYYPKVVAKEEAFLKHKFGESYEIYVKEVPRWIPSFKLYAEPEQFFCMPRFIRKTAMDAAIFFLPLPCFVTISLLQQSHWLPIWLTLP